MALMSGLASSLICPPLDFFSVISRALGLFQLLVRWPGTLSRILPWTQQPVQTVLGVYLLARYCIASGASVVIDE